MFRKAIASLVLAIPASLFAQTIVPNTAAVDGSYAVNYASNLNLGDGVVNVTNTGISAGTDVPLVNRNSYGDICVNAYVYAPDQELAACCTCLVSPNSLHSWPVYFGPNSLLSKSQNGYVNQAIISGNYSVVIKLYATKAANITGNDPNSARCNNPGNVLTNIGSPATGLVAWGTHSHPTNTSTVAITETPFVNSTLSVGEAGKLVTDCNALQGGASSPVCPGCLYGGLDVPAPSL